MFKERPCLNIVMINVTGDVAAEGSRLVARLLKGAGHAVRQVFLVRDPYAAYTEQEVATLGPLLQGADVIMLSVYSVFVARAALVTRVARRLCPGVPVIWGGPHCISAPEMSLRHADGVCFGEGELSVVEYVARLEQGNDYLATPNMAFRRGEEVKQNRALPPLQDLDALPFPDYELQDEYLLSAGPVRLTPRNLEPLFPRYPFRQPTYWILASRGCPQVCSYCNNVRYVALHGRQPIRHRGTEHVLGELEYALERLPFVRRVAFSDDDFPARPAADLRTFADAYRRRIGLPFAIQASPTALTPEKLEILLAAGLELIQMGVETGSQRVLDEVYNRRISVKRTRRAVRELRPYTEERGLSLILDVLLDNPYEAPEEVLETFYLLLEAPPRARINAFILSLFPGTPLYDRARQDGFIDRDSDEAFRDWGDRGNVKFQRNYPTLLLLLLYALHAARIRRFVPARLLRALAADPAAAAGRAVPGGIYAGLFKLMMAPARPLWRLGKLRRPA